MSKSRLPWAFAALALFAITRGRVIVLAKQGTPIERAARALELALEKGDARYVRELARQLRAEGETELADKLDQGMPLLERLIAQRSRPKPTWPADADPVADAYLLEDGPPSVLSQEDLMIAAWMRHEENGGPAFVKADLYPDEVTTRQLTPRERWFLGPYFPVAQDLDAELHFSKPPPGAAEYTKNLFAVTTRGANGKVWINFPNGPQSMLSRWWLSLLAHELTHGTQYRLGMTERQAEDEFVRWNYVLSPIEVQARYIQRVVYWDLARRAREFWLSRGPMPLFP
jgi:hypothetical protein